MRYAADDLAPVMQEASMDSSGLPSFLTTVSMAMRLDPWVFAAVPAAPGGIWLALAIVAVAGVSEATGQSLFLFLNHIRPARFGLAIAIATVSHFVGYLVWTLTVWLAGGFFFHQQQPLLLVAGAVGLAYAPLLLSFFVLTPYLGNLFSVILSLWSMLAVIIAIRVGMQLETWQAIALAGLGWLLLQTMRRTVGRPIIRLQRWIASRAAGVALDVRAKDVNRVRRRPINTWYTQLESWRRRPAAPAQPLESPPGGAPHVRHTG